MQEYNNTASYPDSVRAARIKVRCEDCFKLYLQPSEEWDFSSHLGLETKGTETISFILASLQFFILIFISSCSHLLIILFSSSSHLVLVLFSSCSCFVLVLFSYCSCLVCVLILFASCSRLLLFSFLSPSCLRLMHACMHSLYPMKNNSLNFCMLKELCFEIFFTF